ncbi:MAG: hypothetical protein ACE5HZ_05050 [Fidelibacterota bacterium]
MTPRPPDVPRLVPVLMVILATALQGQQTRMSKADYYNTYVAPKKGRLPIKKILGFEDRKRSVLDVGNLVLRFSNAATLGYDRWGLNHEFPAGSMAKEQCCTYYWTLSPMIGGLIKGQPSVAVGVRGALRDSEEEFEPLPGYDADFVDETNNIGIAFNDKPASWPVQWPIEIDPTGTYTDAVTNRTFAGLERPLDMDHPDGSGLRFPGVLDGKVVAPREAYFVVTENDPLQGNTLESNGIGPLNVRVDMWALQYGDILNQDFIVWWERFTNVGSDTLYEVYVGLAGDPDTPEQGGQEWTDDYSLFIERGDPLIADKLADTTDARLLWDLAVIWDGDDQAEGFISSGVAWIGLKALKTPNTQTADGLDNDWDGLTDEGFDGLDNDGDGDVDEEDEQEQMGITNYYPYPYSLDAQSDNEAYFTQIRSGFGHDSPNTGYQEDPHTNDIQQKPYAYGPDITVVMTSGPFTLRPGESLDFVFADILGVNELDLLTNAKTAQRLYENDFKGPQPPDEPIVHGVAGDGEITLYWDAYPSEYSIDPFTGTNAFEGYKVYKSSDRGATWGEPITDAKGNTVFFKPQAIYDIENEWSTPYAYGSPAVYYDLGSNSGLKYTYTDENVINGVEYWYAVAAYDHPDSTAAGLVPPLENPPKKARSEALASGNNTVVLIPQARSAGWKEGLIDLTHLQGNSTADLGFEVYDSEQFKGYRYLVSISDDLDDTDDTTKTFSVLNDRTFSIESEISSLGTSLPHRNILEESVVVSGPGGEEFLADVDFAVDPEEGTIYALEDTAGITPATLERGTSYTVSYKYYPIFRSPFLAGEASNPSFEGVRMNVEDVSEVVQDPEATLWYNPDDPDSAATTNWSLVATPETSPGNPDDYEIRFSTDSTDVLAPPGLKIPIELWNVTDSVRFDKIIVAPTPIGGVIKSGTALQIIEVPNFQETPAITWKFLLSRPDPALAIDSTYLIVPGFDTLAVVDSLEPTLTDLVSELVDTLQPVCAAPEVETVFMYDSVSVAQFNLETLTFDTLPGLKVTATVQAVCDTSIDPVIGDAVFMGSSKPLTVDDLYLIQTSESSSILSTGDQLKEVKVVPNPYVVTSAYETNIETKELQFHHLPETCTIRVFTLAGELVQVLKHQPGSKGWRGSSTEAWDLRTYNNQEVAFGIYIFHVEAEGKNSRGEEKTFSEIGKFAIIR